MRRVIYHLNRLYHEVLKLTNKHQMLILCLNFRLKERSFMKKYIFLIVLGLGFPITAGKNKKVHTTPFCALNPAYVREQQKAYNRRVTIFCLIHRGFTLSEILNKVYPVGLEEISRLESLEKVD